VTTSMGYAGWAPAGLCDEVLRLGAALVDVRVAPTSASPQWRKDALAALLGRSTGTCLISAIATPAPAGHPR